MKRPSTVTTLLWMVLCLVVWNGIRLIAALGNWTTLAEFAPRPGPHYILITASFWTLSGFALWVALRLRRVSHARVPLFFLLGYAAWWWMDRLLLQTYSANWLFALILTLLLCAWAAIIIFHPHTTEYFTQRETYDPNPTDSKTA